MQHNRDKPCGMMSADEPSMGGEPRIVGSVGADAIGAIGDAVTADVSLLAALHKHVSTYQHAKWPSTVMHGCAQTAWQQAWPFALGACGSFLLPHA